MPPAPSAERISYGPRRVPLMSAILFRRHEALQLLVPMLHDDERGRRGARVGFWRFDHQEALTVGRYVVRAATATGRASIVAPLEEFYRRAGVPRRNARFHRHAQQRTIRP